MEHEGPGPAVRDDSRAAFGKLPVDHAILANDACEIHLGDRFDDSRATYAGNTERLHRLCETRIIRPEIRADHAETDVERLAVDAHAFDGTSGSALAAADLGALEGRAGRARAGEQAVAIAEHDLRIRAHVDDERDFLEEMRLFGQHHCRSVRPDMARDAGKHVDGRARINLQVQVTRPRMQCAIGRERERRAAELHGTDAEEQVMHDWIAGNRDIQDVPGFDAGLARDVRDELVDTVAHDVRQFVGCLGMHEHVRHAAHQVFTEANLRIHDAARRQVLAGRQVIEMRGNGRRADIDCQAVSVAPESRPYRNDL